MSVVLRNGALGPPGPRRAARGSWLAAAWLCAAALCGCAPVTVEFSGRETTPIAEAKEIAYADVMPGDHELVGKLQIECSGRTESRSASYSGTSVHTGDSGVDAAFAGAGLALSLLSLVGSPGPPPMPCQDGVIDREARKRVAEVGGTLIVAFSCDAGGSSNHVESKCTADVGRKVDRPRGPPPPLDMVRVRFLPERGNPQLLPLSPDMVTISEETPRSALLLGAVLGGCVSGCTREAVESKMREASAKAGAGLLSDLSCREERGAFICRSKAWMPVERVAPRAPAPE